MMLRCPDQEKGMFKCYFVSFRNDSFVHIRFECLSLFKFISKYSLISLAFVSRVFSSMFSSHESFVDIKAIHLCMLIFIFDYLAQFIDSLV